MDVPQETSEAVLVVEVGILLELHARPGSRERRELALRLPRVALALSELRRVHLDEADALAAPEIQRVPVADARDGGDLTTGLGRRGAARDDESRGESRNRETQGV